MEKCAGVRERRRKRGFAEQTRQRKVGRAEMLRGRDAVCPSLTHLHARIIMPIHHPQPLQQEGEEHRKHGCASRRVCG
jgi:hypothetical protein